MCNNLKFVIFCWILLSASTAVFAGETGLADLLSADKVKIKTWIQPEQEIKSKQQVKLFIEVSTDKWFSGGTHIGHFEIDDAIVLQREKFAVNSTRNENSKSWTVQQWTLEIYPLREGRFTVPEIPLDLSIAGENLEAIIGRVKTGTLNFTVTLPVAVSNELETSGNWISTTQFKISENYNKSTDELKIGEALIRTIHFTADNIPAMMLPKVNVKDIPGIAIYQKPPQIEDKVNRGEYKAERTEILTYVFEKPGTYQLPALIYYWWNLDADTLEKAELPALAFHVADSSLIERDLHEISQLQALFKDINVTLLLIQLMTVLTVLWFFWRIVRKLQPFIKHNIEKLRRSTGLSEKILQRKFDKACRRNDMSTALRIFYQWLDLYSDDTFQASLRVQLTRLNYHQLISDFNQIMRQIYTSGNRNNITLRRFADDYNEQLAKSNKINKKSHWQVKLSLN